MKGPCRQTKMAAFRAFRVFRIVGRWEGRAQNRKTRNSRNATISSESSDSEPASPTAPRIGRLGTYGRLSRVPSLPFWSPPPRYSQAVNHLAMGLIDGRVPFPRLPCRILRCMPSVAVSAQARQTALTLPSVPLHSRRHVEQRPGLCGCRG